MKGLETIVVLIVCATLVGLLYLSAGRCTDRSKSFSLGGVVLAGCKPEGR